MSGIRHAKNSRDKWGYKEICKPYINYIEKLYKKNKSYRFTSSGGSDEQVENNHRSHLWRIFWYSYQQYKKGRKRKQYLRKIFKYWYGCPNAWGDRNYDFLKFDLTCYWPMYATSEIRSSIGNPVVFPKIRDILLHNQKALTKEQFSILMWDITWDIE